MNLATGLANDVLDFLGIEGIFEESRVPPKRYIIDCIVTFNSGSAASPNVVRASEITGADKARLHYSGPAPHGLMVFSRPIDDGLVQLVILDMRP